MREKLTAHVRNLFRNAADTPRNRDLEEEILQNTLDRFDDLIANGVGPESAYAQAVANLGNVESLLDQPVYVPPQTKKKKSGARTVLIVIAVAVAVLLLLVIGLVVLIGLNFAGSSGFGRYEKPGGGIESVEESVENWAEGLETKVESFVEDAMDGGFVGFSYHYADENSYSIGSAEAEARNVNRLVIDWIAGSVTVEPYDGDTISVSEPEQSKEKNRLRWRQEGETLTIRYCASTGSGDVGAKDLTVKIPSGLWAELQYVQIGTVSADANVSGLEIGELQFNSTSGGFDFVGKVKEAEIDTVSGDAVIACSETPDDVSFDSTSGDLTLLLPKHRSFEAEMDTVSGIFRSDYGKTYDDHLYYEGTESGRPAEFDFDTVSGDVSIEKAAADKVSAS